MNPRARAGVSVCPRGQCQLGTGMFETQIFPCAGGNSPGQARGTPPATPTLLLWCWPPFLSSPCPDWDLSLHPSSSNTPGGEALAFPAQSQRLGQTLSHHTNPSLVHPPCWGYPSPEHRIWGSQEYPSGLIIFPWRGGFFFSSALHTTWMVGSRSRVNISRRVRAGMLPSQDLQLQSLGLKACRYLFIISAAV